MGDIFKLPKWAQLEITRLERLTNELRTALNDASGSVENPDFHYDRIIGTEFSKVQLPKSITLYIPAKHYGGAKDNFMISRETDGDISIRTHTNSLEIYPRASNSIVIKSGMF